MSRWVFMRVGTATLAVLTLAISAGGAFSELAGFQNHRFNGRDPVHRGGISTFLVKAGDCSHVRYMERYPSTDCYNGNLRSRMSYADNAKLGDTLQYEMEVLVPSGVGFGGGRNPRSALEIAEWNRINTIKNHVHTIHLDWRRGITFDGLACISPREFGTWNSIVFQVHWTMNNDGIERVLCNGRVVLNRSGRTAIPPDCASDQSLECDPRTQEPDQPIQFQIGLLFRGYGPYHRERGISSVGRLPPEDGFTVQFRNVSVRKIRFR